MTDRPIIFSAPMVLALLAGRKTMTRRLAWRPPKPKMIECRHGFDTCPECDQPKPSPWQRVKPGDRLWVRENVRIQTEHSNCYFEADKRGVGNAAFAYLLKHTKRWTDRVIPCIHMPRAVSRITLIATGTKIERLQNITNADCTAEGAEVDHVDPMMGQPMVRIDGHSWEYQTVRLWYHRLWDSLNGAGAWDTNPEVVASTFSVHHGNIDVLPKAAAA